MKKLLLGIVATVVLMAGGAAAFLALKTPAQRPAPDLKVEATPERLERGRYLVEHVSACLHCHSPGDESRWGLPHKPELRGAGGLCLTEAMGFAGTLCATNITQHPQDGIGQWTDGELLRAIREGVDKNGQALFPLMPYDNFRHLSDDDALAVVAYLRTLPPVPGQRPARQLKFPLPIVVKFIPQPLTSPVSAPNKSDSVAYGRYLVTAAGCETCHTPVDGRHQPLPGKAFSGGQPFPFEQGGAVVSPNLTPHATGLGGRTRENFIALFKAYATPQSHNLAVAPNKNTPMPWLMYAGMTEEDLGAIYDYLRTVPPIENRVEKFPAQKT
ncbi:MAG: c-type cytochrome [Hyalangium sp.]|uniref:c-type cytochrome n=1 Tax=Hyalangium sp. TaxID=2028555 RepID=UPI00389AD179